MVLNLNQIKRITIHIPFVLDEREQFIQKRERLNQDGEGGTRALITL